MSILVQKKNLTTKGHEFFWKIDKIVKILNHFSQIATIMRVINLSPPPQLKCTLSQCVKRKSMSEKNTPSMMNWPPVWKLLWPHLAWIATITYINESQRLQKFNIITISCKKLKIKSTNFTTKVQEVYLMLI